MEKTIKFLFGLLYISLLSSFAALLVIFALALFTPYGDIFTQFLETEGKHETLEFIGLGLGGVLAAIGAVELNRRATAAMKNSEAMTKNAEEMAKNNALTEKGHIQERLKAAMQSLGHIAPSVRIAAFYQFYRLAKDNSDKDFVKNIFDILCAHLRHLTSNENYRQNEGQYAPTEECQSLLNVLFKNPQDIFVVADMRVNLRGIHLVGANFHKAHLRGVSFHRANLQHADFWHANVEEAVFLKSNLQKANFTVAHAYYAFFQRADVAGADFTNAYLHRADMTDVKNLDKAKFHRIKGECVFPTEFKNFTKLGPGKKYPE